MKHFIFFIFLNIYSFGASAYTKAVRYGNVDVNTAKYIDVAAGITTDNYAFKITSQSMSGDASYSITYQDCVINQVYEQDYCSIIVRFLPTTFARKTATLTVNITYYPEPDMVDSYTVTYVGDLSGTGYRRLSDDEPCLKCPIGGGGGSPSGNPNGSPNGGPGDGGNPAVNVDNTSINQMVPITGVPYSLAYSSDVSVFDEFQSLGLGGFNLDGFKYYDAQRGNTLSADGTIRKAPAVVFNGKNYTMSRSGNELYEFNSDGKINAVIDPMLGITKAQFNYGDQSMSITDNFGNVTSLQKVGANTEITSPYGQVTTVSFDPVSGFPKLITNPNSEVFEIGFDTNANLTSFKKPAGQISTKTYDAISGRLLADAGPGGYTRSLSSSVVVSGADQTQTATLSSPLNIATTSVFTSKSNGSVGQVTGPNSKVFNRSVITGLSETSSDSYGYNNSKNMTPDPRFGSAAPYVSHDETTVSGTSISIVRDTVKSTTLANPSDPLSHTGLLTSTKFQNDTSRTYYSLYTTASRTLIDRSPLLRKLTRIFNANGSLNSEQVGSLTATNYTYNTMGLPLTIKRSTTRTTTLTYNSLGQIATYTNPVLLTEQYLYDLSGRLKKTTLPDTNTIDYSYDLNGRMTSLKVPGGAQHNFTHNDFGKISSYTPPVVGTGGVGNVGYSYNLDKNLTLVTFGDSKTVTHNYGSTTGFLNSKVASDSSGNFSYTYKAATDLISQIISPDGIVLDISYVADQIQKFVTTLPSVVTEYAKTFDGEFRPSSESIKVGSVTAPAINYAYDLDSLKTVAGDITQVIDANQLMESNTLGVLTESVTKNIFGEVVFQKIAQGSTIKYQDTRTVDNLGRLATSSLVVNGSSLGTSTYDYDNRGRLYRVLNGSTVLRTYLYSANGNRTTYSAQGSPSINGTYDAQDRLLTYGTKTYTYNTRGALQTIVNSSPSQTTQLSYDLYGQLKSVTMPSGVVISYKLDGLSRRVARYVNGVFNRGFIYNDKDQLVGEINSSNSLAVQYVYLTRPNVPDYAIVGTTKLRIVSNQIGTPRMLINSATGAVVEILSLNEFGVGTNSVNLSIGFAGGLADPDTKFVRFGVRDYDPETGRWMSKDPILFDGDGANLYAYALNDPVNFFDSNGEFPSSWQDAYNCLNGTQTSIINDYQKNIDRNLKKIAEYDKLLSEPGLCSASRSNNTKFRNVLVETNKSLEQALKEYKKVCSGFAKF